MVVIHLYGILEQTAQRVVQLETSSFDESMRALAANFPKMMRVLRKLRVSVLVNGEMFVAEDGFRTLTEDRIDIMPIVGGNGPAIFIVIGAALEAGAATIAAWAATIGLGSVITAATIAQFGLALIIGGISQLLFKPPKPDLGSRASDAASYNFNGAVNVAQQGNIVPVGYGRLRVGSMVVAANVQTWDIPVDPTTVVTSGGTDGGTGGAWSGSTVGSLADDDAGGGGLGTEGGDGTPGGGDPLTQDYGFLRY